MPTATTERRAGQQEGVVFEGGEQIGRDRVTLRLRCYSGAKFVLERQLVRVDGVTLTQVFTVENEAALHDFATADPYGDTLRATYQSIRQSYLVERDAGTTYRIANKSTVDIAGEINRIEHCQNEAELMAVAHAVTSALGATQYIFSRLILDDKSGDVIEYRYLVGCDPAWLNKYIDRVWYMNDPSLEYAKRNVTPALSSQLDLYSDGHWLPTEAAAHGFRNNLVCPVHVRANHGRTNSLVAILQASNGESKEAGEGVLWVNRLMLRALASELLDWHLTGQRQQATSEFGLDEQDLDVLRRLRSGGTAKNIAEALDLSVKTVYASVYPKVNKKMGASHITNAVAMAVNCGLIE